ncbi:MAG: hypothetical protein RIC55_13020 [Pirellulaceae bacterium]
MAVAAVSQNAFRSRILRGALACLLCLAGCQTETPRVESPGAESLDADPTQDDATLDDASSNPQLAIEPNAENPAQVTVVASAAPRDWFPGERIEDVAYCRQILALYLANNLDPSDLEDSLEKPVAATPMLGTYHWREGRLEFQPRFGLVPGQRYLARFDPRALGGESASIERPLTATYAVADSTPDAAPHVEAIYPSAQRLPANHLKFYLVFDRPMQRGDVFRHFRLFDLTEDREVPGPFRLTELWSRDERRLTLWFHPGRQKDGVNLNVEFGPILEAGHRYRLEISGDWKSADGQALGSDCEKTFAAGAVDRVQPDPATWEITPPARASTSPLVCRFRESLDWALLHSEMHVEDASGAVIAGDVQTSDGETCWRFTPRQPWSPGKHRLAVGVVLEDLAGNSIERPFERDIAAESSPTSSMIVYRDFEIAE